MSIAAERPYYTNGKITGAFWYTCKIHTQGLPSADNCCASADRYDRSLVEANTEIGGCTVTWDADEAEVARSLLHGDSVALVQRMGFRKFGEISERVFKKFNKAVIQSLRPRTMEEIQAAFKKARSEAHETYLESEG